MQQISPNSKIKKEKWLITVGHLIHVKGTDYLAEIALRVLKQCPDWKWLVVGSGADYSFLKKFIEKNQLDEQLILTGRISDVNSYLEKSQIYVMTSRSEGLPMSLLEAKAYYIPTISFDIATGPNEIIEDGVNGYLVPPFDCEQMALKIKQLIANENLRAEFAAHTYDNIKKFQIENVISSWNHMLETIM